jgi:hypothetical protein
VRKRQFPIIGDGVSSLIHLDDAAAPMRKRLPVRAKSRGAEPLPDLAPGLSRAYSRAASSGGHETAPSRRHRSGDAAACGGRTPGPS